MDKLIALLDEAYVYVTQRPNPIWQHNHDYWSISRDRSDYIDLLGHLLISDQYIFSPCIGIQYKPGKYLHKYRMPDTIVLKALAMRLKQLLPNSPLCYSVCGQGGVKAAINTINNAPGEWYLKTDVSDYYASIDLYLLMQKLHCHLPHNSRLAPILYKALHRLNSDFSQVKVGLPRGSALSHVLGNFYLYELDVMFERRDTQIYVRYMDDILVRANSRGAIRRADKTLKFNLAQLGLRPAYNKSYIGRTRQPIKFLGDWIVW